jgi:hypothetical protein
MNSIQKQHINNPFLILNIFEKKVKNFDEF